MKRLGEFVNNQSKILLENKQHAILYAVALSMLPFASWLSVALVALVTLRRGAKAGFEVMIPALVIHSVPLMMVVPLDSVLVNTLITYIPCYMMALVLRNTRSWQAVFGMIFFQMLAGCLLVQILAPDFIVNQFNQFKAIFADYPEYQQLFAASTEGMSSIVLTQLFFGIQLFTVVVSTILSLAFARSIQAKLFNPGGFREELVAFRCGKLAFIVLTTVLIASYYEIPLAINVLIITLTYFILSGFGLAYFVLAREQQLRVAVILMLLVLLKPALVLFAYLVFGSLDSLFNLRLYLPGKARKST